MSFNTPARLGANSTPCSIIQKLQFSNIVN
jgi:hypothetical protein